MENSLGTIDQTVEIIEKENNEENEVISGDKKTVPVSKPTQTTTNRSNLPTIQNGSYLIYYFDDGFYPNTLQVRQGSPIRYINKSEGAMRIFASDQKKLMFRELNQPTTVGNGGTYDFTFTQTGVWFYTNYNNKVHKASVLVY